MRNLQRFDAAPLVRAVELRNITLGVGHPLARSMHRARTLGWVGPRAADQLAVHLLNMHPVELWPNEWIRAS